MRWSRVGCLLVIAVAVVLAKERPKRHLGLLKKIASHILATDLEHESSKEENYKLYKIPGLDHVLIKAVPKVTVKETDGKIIVLKPINPSVPVVKPCKDNEANNIGVLQNLLTLGIFEDKQKVIVPINPHQANIKYTETETNEQYEVKSPGLTDIRKPMYVIPTIGSRFPESVSVIHKKPIAVELPPISFVPGHVKFSQIVNSTSPTKYSYIQSSHDGMVTTYESQDNPNVVVTKTTTIPVLPSFIKVRIQEAAVIGAYPPRVMQPVPVFPAYPQPMPVPGIPIPPPFSVIRLPGVPNKGTMVPHYLPPLIVQNKKENPFWLGAPIPLQYPYPPITDMSISKLNTNGKVHVNISTKKPGKTSNNIDAYNGGTSNNDIKTQTKYNSYQDDNPASTHKEIPAPPPMITSNMDSSANSYVTDGHGTPFKPSDAIVVPDDEPFVYRQNNADGSTISMKGNAQNIVSVHVEENNNSINEEGDIPGARY